MAIVGDILQASFFYHRGGNEAMIVQFFQVTALGTSTLFEQDAAYTLLQKMGVDLWPLWGHVESTFDRVRVVNVSDELGFSDLSETFAGGIGNHAMPIYDSISIRQTVPSLLTRGGFKRLPYGSESQNNNGVWDLPALDRDEILAFFQDETLLIDYNAPHAATGGIIHPVIVGRTLNSDVPPVYELDLSKVQLVVEASPRGWTTQNTRK